MNTETNNDTVREAVRHRYAEIAEASTDSTPTGCGCAPSCCGGETANAENDYASKLGYSDADVAAVPQGANLNLGCGNPLAIASLRTGETVLDLGSGAGFDCFIAARQLAGSGKVIGVDMTPAMISKARRHAEKSGHANVEFRLGEIEALPVADASVDIVISNCVINLSPDKPRVFREAFRVIKPGGRISISDVVARAPIPAQMRQDFEKITGCVAGAETIEKLEGWLRDAGFVDVSIRPRDESKALIDTWFDDMPVSEWVVSAIIEARKPTE